MALGGKPNGQVEPYFWQNMRDTLLIEDQFWVVNPFV